MQLKFIFSASLITLLTGTALTAAESEMVVAVKPQLAMRKNGDVRAKVIRQIPYGASVKVVAIPAGEKYQVNVLELVGAWYQVEYENAKGWVFGPLLRRPDEKFSYVVLGEKAIKDDPAIATPALISEALQGNPATVELKAIGDSFNCSGKLALKLNPKDLRSGTASGILDCSNMTAGDVKMAVKKWHLYSGAIYVEGRETGNWVCHSERCENADTTINRNGVRKIDVVKKTGAGSFEVVAQ